MAYAGIIPEIPSFGQQLARGLGAGASKGVDTASDFLQKMALKKAENASLEGLLSGMKSNDKNEDIQGFKPFSAQEEAMLALKNPQAFKAYEVLKSSHEKKEEKNTLKSDLGGTLNSLAETMKKGRLGYTTSRFSAEGRRDTKYFDVMAVQLESIAKDMISKGVLARDRFNYLLGNLPSSGNTDATNAGAIEAWADELKIPRPEGLERFYKKSNKLPFMKNKRSVQSDMVRMRGPDGSEESIPKSQVNNAMAEGAIVIK